METNTQLIDAYAVNQPDAENVIAIRYNNENKQRVTVFLTASNQSSVDRIINVINNASKNSWKKIDSIPKDREVQIHCLFHDGSRRTADVVYDDVEEIWMDSFLHEVIDISAATHWREIVNPIDD